ncbi:MAG: heparinase II/III family protein [Planctomycetes bacterium]|nr:heparinase II/III family protein [Planctomycetota bacterium]MBL7038069.1 heparinase II/III family protein [Pirellulaceae bacterium]
MISGSMNSEDSLHCAKLTLCLVLAVMVIAERDTAGLAVPDIPKGVSPEEFYGGFFPTETWVASLRPLPRQQRGNPQLAAYAESLDVRQLADLHRQIRPFMRVDPEAFLEMVPRRNRLAGNARVMPARSRQTTHLRDTGYLVWTPDKPNELRDAKGTVIDPLKHFPPTGEFRITGPKGDVQRYPYHDTPDGKRIYVQAEFMDGLRVRELSRAVRALGILYHKTEDVDYAKRAAAILYDFACAVPHWPKIARGYHSGFEGKDRFRPVDEHIVYASLWYDKYHSGLGNGPEQLALGYDLIQNAPVWDWLDERTEGADVRLVIDRDLFLYTAKDAIRYDVHFPQPDSALSNYIPYQTRGLICIGAAIGVPELVHYARWKIEQMVEKTILADAVFPEGPSYFRQHIVNMERACEIGRGYNDPTGFVSSIDGTRIDNMDLMRDLPMLRRSVETLARMTYPSGNYITVDDTHWRYGRGVEPPHEETVPVLFHAYGHAILGRGRRAKDNQFQAHLNFSGNWGHDHCDMLNLILWPYRDDLVCDIGYVHTYRPYADWSLGHNLVVVDRHSQQQVNDPGRLLSWHPVRDGVQVVEASAPHVYPQTRTYQRALILIPIGQQNNLVVDIFEVEGGSVHEWMAHGSGVIEQTLTVNVPLQFYGESYADDRLPFEPPAHSEYMKQRTEAGLNSWHLEPSEPDPWYGVIRDIHVGRIAGPFQATLAAQQKDYADIRLHVLEPTDGRVFTATAPSCRRGAADDITLVEKNRMPKLIIRRDGQDLCSRFVVLWEPQRGKPIVESVLSLTTKYAGLSAIRIVTTDAPRRTITVLHSRNPAKPHTVDGFEFVGRTAVLMENTTGKTLWLYEATRFKSPWLELTVHPHRPLPLAEVVQGEGNHHLALAGTWTAASDDPAAWLPSTSQPNWATLTLGGDHHRPMPINAIEERDGRTILHGLHSSGFKYDPQTKKLTESCSPYRKLQGEAQVTLPNRVIIEWQNDNPSKPTRVRSTVPITLSGIPMPLHISP